MAPSFSFLFCFSFCFVLLFHFGSSSCPSSSFRRAHLRWVLHKQMSLGGFRKETNALLMLAKLFLYTPRQLEASMTQIPENIRNLVRLQVQHQKPRSSKSWQPPTAVYRPWGLDLALVFRFGCETRRTDSVTNYLHFAWNSVLELVLSLPNIHSRKSLLLQRVLGTIEDWTKSMV